MASNSVHRSTLALIVALWIGVVVTLGAARLDLYFQGPLLEHGDIAVNALQVENAKHLRELYGNYSRFEFNHPGPAFFYIYAAAEWILYDWLGLVPTPGNAHLVASMALQALFFAGAIALFSRQIAHKAWLPLALVLAALYFSLYRDAFVSIWPPHVLLMPFFFFLTACVTLATGDLRSLPWVVAGGGFLFHGHVAQPLFVGGLGALAIGIAGQREYMMNGLRTRSAWYARHGRTFAACLAIVVIFLLPLFIDVLNKGSRGNVATILGTFAANSSDKKTLLQSALYFLSFGSTTQSQDELFTRLGPESWEFFRARPGLYALHAALWFIPLGLLWKFPARFEYGERRFLLKGYLFLGAAVLLCLFWGRAQAGGMHQFNGFFYYGVYFFGFLLALGTFVRVLNPPWPVNGGVVALCCAAVIATWSFRSRMLTDEQSGRRVLQAVEAALAADPSDAPKLLRFEHADWPEAAPVALALERRGVGVYLAPWWTFMFGARHDESLLGPEPEKAGVNWWLTPSEAGDGFPVTDTLSLHVEPALLDPDGTRLEFGEGARGLRYLVSGLTVGNIDLAWTDLPRLAFMFKPGPAGGDVRIAFDAQSNAPVEDERKERRAEVRFNGHDLGTVTVSDRAVVGVTVPKNLWNGAGVAVLELRFPEAKPVRTAKRPGYESWQAWGLWSVYFSTRP